MVNYLRAYFYLRSLTRRAYWSKDRLKEFQRQELKRMLYYAYENVPFYHEMFKSVGLRPEDVKAVEDLGKLPIVRKDDIRRNLGQLISRECDIPGLHMHRTSGSTGEPLQFYITGGEDEYRKARHIRANAACGQKLRDRYVTITHPLYFGQTTKLQRLLRFYSTIPVSVFDDVDKQISLIERLKPDVLDGYASSIVLLANRIGETGAKTVKPRLLISGADLVDAASRKHVEEVFGSPFYDQYGCAELERLAWQCKEKAGYHIEADTVVMQFVDKNGEEVAAEETGEIVCTSLFNFAMPFIRYAVGDVGKASTEDCPCGRGLPLMRIIEGRKDDVILLPDGRAMSSFAFIAAMYQLSFYSSINRFRVVQEKNNAFRFLIKLKHNNVDEKSAEQELVTLFRRVLNVVDVELEFNVNFVSDIPVDETGKFKIVISKVQSKS